MSDNTKIMENLRPLVSESAEVKHGLSLKEALLRATFSPNKALNPIIDGLYTGELNRVITTLVRTTLADPRKREAGILIYTKPDFTLFYNPAPVIGDEDSVLLEHSVASLSNDPNASPFSRQNRHVGTAMHTHGNEDLPPSPKDHKRIIIDSNHPFSAPAVFVATPYTLYAIFRGPNTPALSMEEATAKVDKWTDMLLERMRRHTLDPYMSEEARYEMTYRAQSAFIRDFSEKYGLKVFTGRYNDDPNASVLLKARN